MTDVMPVCDWDYSRVNFSPQITGITNGRAIVAAFSVNFIKVFLKEITERQVGAHQQCW